MKTVYRIENMYVETFTGLTTTLWLRINNGSHILSQHLEEKQILDLLKAIFNESVKQNLNKRIDEGIKSVEKKAEEIKEVEREMEKDVGGRGYISYLEERKQILTKEMENMKRKLQQLKAMLEIAEMVEKVK